MASQAKRLSPRGLKDSLPVTDEVARSVQEGRDAFQRALKTPIPLIQNSSHPGLLVMVGPCSIHDTAAGMEYAQRLAAAAKKYRGELLIAMRVYIEKPRTTVGWKGLVHDPDLVQGEESDLTRGLSVSREIMLRVAELGLPIVTEVLSPFVLPFIQDLLSCGIIGARTTESQTHREIASDAPMPVGFKNGTNGTVSVALDAIQAAAQPHSFLSVDDDGHLIDHFSAGNPDTFVVLRGGSDGPNYSAQHIRQAELAMANARQPVRLVVDCSHGNSMKDYRRQPEVAANVANQISAGAAIAGVMLESNINPGRQNISPDGLCGLQYGVSVTDGCISWEETERVLEGLAASVRARQTVPLTPAISVPLSSMQKTLEKLQPSVSVVELSG
ncbi:uncharacterized protein TRUGW13939_02476 [Talaromyces rugulosus]|uniref:Phospho-2-dehydro-3-deoxyheptonate aldolase n=1 Tax=Talaromyces rugulosus TaxID=121627 RepID=A0A7H8QN86_TALRU|nr:uncharacterized protein TRUGW13939_02476 [Talaromyces rugulosus]QKX55384.1 hypothetical protein TRUGW13939_02476 [Talaromyces rugulosus]